MISIRFNYLYRDGSNFKSAGNVIFANPDNLSTTVINGKLISAFLPDKLFIANQIFITEVFLFIKGIVTQSDHCYHEFFSVETCQEQPTDKLNRSITEFLQDVEKISSQGWKAFDILEHIWQF